MKKLLTLEERNARISEGVKLAWARRKRVAATSGIWRVLPNAEPSLYRCASCSAPIGIDDGKLCQACYQRGAR